MRSVGRVAFILALIFVLTFTSGFTLADDLVITSPFGDNTEDANDDCYCVSVPATQTLNASERKASEPRSIMADKQTELQRHEHPSFLLAEPIFPSLNLLRPLRN